MRGGQGGGGGEGVREGGVRGQDRKGEGRGKRNLLRGRSEVFSHYSALLLAGERHVVDGRSFRCFSDLLFPSSIRFTRHSSAKVRGWEQKTATTKS